MDIISGDIDTPVTLYEKYVGEKIGFLLESNEQPKGRYSFIGTNPYMIIEGHADGKITVTKEDGQMLTKEGNPLEVVKDYLQAYEVMNETAIPFVGGAVGSVGYDMIRQYEDLDHINEDTIGVPDIHLLFVKEIIAYDHETHRIHLIVLEEEGSEGEKLAREKLQHMQLLLHQEYRHKALEQKKEDIFFRSHMKRSTFEEAVKKAKNYIYEGDIFQVVLSRRWSGKFKEKPFNIYRKLRQVNPSPYMFYFNFETYQIAGSSPEMLVEHRQGTIRNCPIAGTIRRGATEEEDSKLAAQLLADEKEQAEHTMLVDLGRNDMGKVSKIGSVHIKSFMEVYKYSHVMHLVTLLEGQKRQDMDIFQTLMSFLPAGTLSGAPKIRAMEIIDELEDEKRGIYGGAIGYFGFDEDMDMCIAIRTMVMKDNTIYLQAGAGIVADSDERKEYEETENKVKGLMVAIKGC